MATWTSEELNKIGNAEVLEIASLQDDGTLRKPTTIWVVRIGDSLYVRAINGRNGVWFQSTQVRHEGHIQAGGVDKDVTFADAEPNLTSQIDAVYRTKYGEYSDDIVGTVLTPEAKAATIKLMPRA